MDIHLFQYQIGFTPLSRIKYLCLYVDLLKISYSVPLDFILFHLQCHTVSITVPLYCLKSSAMSLPTLFFFNIVFNIVLHFCIHFRDIHYIYKNILLGFWLKFHQICRSIWGELFSMLSLLIHNHSKSLHLFWSFLFLSVSIL